MDRLWLVVRSLKNKEGKQVIPISEIQIFWYRITKLKSLMC